MSAERSRKHRGDGANDSRVTAKRRKKIERGTATTLAARTSKPVGLGNHRNCCYFNAALQVLLLGSSDNPLRDYLERFDIPLVEGRSLSTGNSAYSRFVTGSWRFVRGLQALIRKTGNVTHMSTIPVLKQFLALNSTFQPFHQQDSHEALRSILSIIHRILQVPVPSKRHKGKTYQESIVSDVYSGTLRSTIECSQCGKVYSDVEEFLDLSISISFTEQSQINQSEPSPQHSSTKPLSHCKGKAADSPGSGGCHHQSRLLGILPSFVNRMLSPLSSALNSKLRNIQTASATRQSLDSAAKPLQHLDTQLNRSTHFSSYSVPSNSLTLSDCLDNFFGDETLSNKGSHECSACHSTNTRRQYSLCGPPEVLCLHLKRFQAKANSASEKIERYVKFPLRGLDMLKYVLNSGAINGGSQDIDDFKYDLIGLIVHLGSSSNTGHYVAYVLYGQNHVHSSTMDSKHWFLCNDSAIKRVSENEVQSQQAYVLLYRRRRKVAHAAPNAMRTPYRGLCNYLYQKTDDVEQPVCFISSYWLKKLEVFGANGAGSLSNARVVCKHGHISSYDRKCLEKAERGELITARPVVAIPMTMWKILLASQSVGLAQLEEGEIHSGLNVEFQIDNSLEASHIQGNCPACVEIGSRLATQRRIERDFLMNLTSDLPRRGERWYIIDAVWMRKWQEWIYNKRRIPLVDQVGCQQFGYDEDIIGVQPPGPITNSRLLGEIEASPPAKSYLAPRPGLDAAVHYRGVSKSVWQFLVENHGGGPTISRKSLDLYAL